MDRKGVSQSRLTHPLIEECEIRGMEDAVAETGECRAQHQPGIAVGQAEHDAGERQHPDAETEDAPATHAIDDEAGERLSDAADHEERRGEQSDVGEAEREITHQPREQGRQHQVEKVRRAMRQPNESDDLAVSGRAPDAAFSSSDARLRASGSFIEQIRLERTRRTKITGTETSCRLTRLLVIATCVRVVRRPAQHRLAGPAPALGARAIGALAVWRRHALANRFAGFSLHVHRVVSFRDVHHFAFIRHRYGATLRKR